MSKEKEELLREVIEIEWRMFQNVQNTGGRASCQDDPETFEIMRHSEGMNRSEATLESYLHDLKEAEKAERNLLTEKYARMMKSTSPQEYARIEHLLPPLDPEAIPLIDKIAEIVVRWQEELAERFPAIVGRGRPIHSWQDSPFATSLETYLRGELMTCSTRTLKLHYQGLQRQKAENINGSEVVLTHMVKRYGYASIEEANEKLHPAY